MQPDSSGRDEPPAISIVIPTFQRQQCLLNCLARLAACRSADKAEVIVVDQTPGATRPANRPDLDAAFRRLKYITLPVANVAAARNVGAASSCGEVILFLDDDVELENSYLDQLIALFAEQRVDCLAGEDVGSFADATRDLGFTKMEWLPSANLSVRRNEFLAAGGFDENLYRYNEDAEFTGRLRVRGVRLGVHSTLRAIHHHEPQGGTRHSRSAFEVARHVLRNDLYFTRAIGGGPILLASVVYRDFKSTMRGTGKIGGGSIVVRLAAFCLSLPAAIPYAYRRPKLLAMETGSARPSDEDFEPGPQD